MAPRITSSTSKTTDPLHVLGYESSRSGGSIVHDVLGGGVDVSLRASGSRSGTLELLYSTEALSSAAETLLAGALTYTLTEPDVTSVNMKFVVTGGPNRRLDPESRALWIVSLDYREVP